MAANRRYSRENSHSSNGSCGMEEARMNRIRSNTDCQDWLKNVSSTSQLVEPHKARRNDDADDSFNHLDHYKHLSERLRSFDNPDWPSGVPVTTEELARAGWFYVGRDDRVQCPWCGGCVFNWVPGDSALGEHRRHFPHCDFVKEHLANAFRPLPKPLKTRSIRRREVTSENWRDSEAVKAAKELELPDDVVESAAKKLLDTNGKYMHVQQLHTVTIF